jgi:hypothetical protein
MKTTFEIRLFQQSAKNEREIIKRLNYLMGKNTFFSSLGRLEEIIIQDWENNLEIKSKELKIEKVSQILFLDKSINIFFIRS